MIEKRMAMFIIAVLIAGLVGGYFMVNADKTTKVELNTNYGKIVLLMYDDMPITTGNFVSLINKKFYDGLTFHRIIDGFMIQGGDPKGDGTGWPGYEIEDEFTHAGGNRNKRGTISMANAGPNTGGCQFFINLADNSFLDTKHPAFGEVVEGIDVIDKIAKVQTDSNDKPLKAVVIESAKVL